jgi:DNA-directed RNA polymerase specialized sigma24 family protein
MAESEPRDDLRGRRASSLPTTQWTLVLAGAEAGTPVGDAALARLCGLYWLPVYAFIRRQGYDADAAHDLTQEFFARMLEKHYLRGVRRERGRFRSFLLASVRHFLSNERDRTRALKRGGRRQILSIDVELTEQRCRIEPHDDDTPETVFDRQWALALLEHVLARLREEFVAAGRPARFEVLKPLLTGDADAGDYGALATALGTSEGAIKVAAHRLRRRYRDLLREEIATLVESPDEVDDELRHLLRALGSR